MIRTTLLAALALLAAPTGAAEDAVEIGRCDGRGTIAVDGLRAGEPLPRAEAQALASRLMTEWRAAHPERRWEAVTVAQRTDQQPGR